MDEKKSNIRLVKTGGRRVTKTKTEYDWNALERNSEHSTRGEARKSRTAFELEKKVRYQKMQKARRLKTKRRRALAVLILAAAVVIVILFMTPIFNIKSISVEGNRIVSEQQLQETLGPLVGENLFRTGEGKIRRTLKSNSFIDGADVQKKMFPPTVKVVITEYTPACFIRTEGKSILTDSNLRALSDDGVEVSPVPVVTGVELENYKIGETVKIGDGEKESIMIEILSTLDDIGIIDKIIEIDVNDITDIRLNYNDKIEILCGTQLGLERKLRLFNESINSGSIEENARGTMDLTEPGKGIFKQ